MAQAATRPVLVRLPADFASEDIAAVQRAGVRTIILSDVTSQAQVQAAASVLMDARTEVRLVLELNSGAALRDAAALAAAHPAVSALWYAMADLVVDLGEDDPAGLYYYDAPEPRLGAPAWTRSRLLTVARAAGVGLWGQLDLTFATPLPEVTLREALGRARLSGFDTIVARHAGAAAGILQSVAW